ncbi:uncharacterized protein G2W53_027515 [Senna tora]|uniref:Uncharacterized protein n=1 Tax=Senna tora TaxID=362788 RepID=A0A834THU1_9FABA|nr:uncharacterized protein G2W53_027515 [Senna tora]
MVACISDGARYLSNQGVGSGDEAEVFGEVVEGGLTGVFVLEEEECTICAVFSRGVGEAEYIVASESSSSVALSSSDTWIGDDDGVGDSFLSSLEDFLLPAILGGYCHVLHSSFFWSFLHQPEQQLHRSHHGHRQPPLYLAMMMPPVIFFIAFSWEYASMEIGSLVEYLLKSPSFRPIHARRFFMVKSIFFPRSIDFPTISPSKFEKERFFVEELEVDLPRRTDASILDVVFESSFYCVIKENFGFFCGFSGR